MKRKTPLILIAVLAAMAAVFWVQQPAEPERLVEVPVSDSWEDTQEVTATGYAGADSQDGPAEPALPDLDTRRVNRRVVQVPSNGVSPRYDNIDEIEESELAAFTRHNLDEALAGDLAAANRVVHARRRCENAPSSIAEAEQQVQQRLQRNMRRSESRGREWNATREEEFRVQTMARYENCRFSDQLFTPDLRAQLERLASQGHVASRYLYALWPPELLGRPDAFLRHQEWAEKALSFTLANLTQGETFGLLAFGQSYSNSGMFTATDRYPGAAFVIAAVDCGLNLDYYTGFVDSFLNSDRFGEARQSVLLMADGLKGFCR